MLYSADKIRLKVSDVGREIEEEQMKNSTLDTGWGTDEDPRHRLRTREDSQMKTSGSSAPASGGCPCGSEDPRKTHNISHQMSSIKETTLSPN